MLDSSLQIRLQGPLTEIGRRLAANGVKAEALVALGFGAGVLAAVLAASGLYLAALLLLVVNRILGAVEKAMARAGGGSDFSFFLATALDLAFWGAFVLAFAFADHAAALVSAILLFALMTLAGTSLAFALAGVRRGLAGEPATADGVGILARLVEETEVAIVFALMCVAPGYYSAMAVLLAFAALATAGFRALLAWRVFR